MIENLVCEEVLPYFNLRGHCHCYEGQSTAEWPAAPPARVIQLDQRWFWAVHFEQTGDLIEVLSGTWRADLYLEKMGGGEFELQPPHSRIQFPFENRQGWIYKPRQVDPRVVPAGVYRSVVSLTFRGPGNSPGPIAAFADMGLMQFYED